MTDKHLEDPEQQSALTSRSIRSFVIRNGRLTPGQERALRELGPQFCLEYNEQQFQPETVFGRVAPLWVEIGFGNGESLANVAEQHPDINFLGLEVHLPGVGHLLNQIGKRDIKNIRIMRHDAIEVLQKCMPDQSIDRVLLFFPDPWHKKRHHKRRIVQAAFSKLISRKLKHDGILHMATDWLAYADHMVEVMQQNSDFANMANVQTKPYSPAPAYRQVTKFETRGLKRGHQIWDIIYSRIK